MAQYGNITSSRRTKRSTGLTGLSKTTRQNRFPSRWGNGGTSDNEAWPRRRPEFMRSLGLLPPYTVQDVNQAYLARAKVTHPDVGGDIATFCRLQESFERALEHAECRRSCLHWIASQVDRYLVQQEIITQIIRLGGTVDLEGVDWLTDHYGEDFAQLAKKIVGIQLRGPRFGDEILAFLVQQPMLIPSLRKLDLAFSHVSDEGLRCLRAFRGLSRLNLQGTRITNRGLSALRFPALQWLNIEGVSISRWGLMKLRWRRPALAVVTPGGRFKRNRNGSSRAVENDIFAQNEHAALLAKIAEIQSRKHR